MIYSELITNWEFLLKGFYRGGRFSFSFKVGPGYPHEPPKVKCETQVYHPNIDLDGNVCLNILREDWKPVLTINSIIYGLQYLFLVSSYSEQSNWIDVFTSLSLGTESWRSFEQRSCRGVAIKQTIIWIQRSEIDERRLHWHNTLWSLPQVGRPMTPPPEKKMIRLKHLSITFHQFYRGRNVFMCK